MTSRLPLLFLPGLLCDGALWAHQVTYLDDIAQPRVMDLTRHDSLRLLARTVLEEAPPRFALVGLSMGGYVAQEIIRQDPSRIMALALFNTSARPDTPDTSARPDTPDTAARPDTPDTAARRHALITLAKSGKFRGVTPRLLPNLVHPDHLHNATITETVLKMAERTGRDAFIRQQTAILNRPDSRPDLPAFHAPTLVVTGRQDALTPLDHAQEMAALLPSATLTVVEDCGHLSPLEQPQAVTALLRLWLTSKPHVS